jgi:hypothetical protein
LNELPANVRQTEPHNKQDCKILDIDVHHRTIDLG